MSKSRGMVECEIAIQDIMQLLKIIFSKNFKTLWKDTQNNKCEKQEIKLFTMHLCEKLYVIIRVYMNTHIFALKRLRVYW